MASTMGIALARPRLASENTCGRSPFSTAPLTPGAGTGALGQVASTLPDGKSLCEVGSRGKSLYEFDSRLLPHDAIVSWPAVRPGNTGDFERH